MKNIIYFRGRIFLKFFDHFKSFVQHNSSKHDCPVTIAPIIMLSRLGFSIRHSSTLTSESLARLNTILPPLGKISSKDLYKHLPSNKYYIQRTSKGNLPIYKTYRSQCVYTDIKRVQGDIVQLRNDLQALLPDIEKKNFTCVMDSKTIKIKGDVSKRLKELLAKKI